MKKFLLLSFVAVAAISVSAQSTTPRQGSFRFIPSEQQEALNPDLQESQ